MPDALEQLREDCGYSEEEDCGVDALIDYKNALENRCAGLEEELRQFAHNDDVGEGVL